MADGVIKPDPDEENTEESGTLSTRQYYGNASDDSSSDEEKEVCQRGEKCCFKSSNHFRDHYHPHLSRLLRIIGDRDIVIPIEYSAQVCYDTLKRQINLLRSIKKDKKQMKEKEKKLMSVKDKPTIQKKKKPKLKYQAWKKKKRMNNVKKLINSKYAILDRLEAAAPYNFFLTAVVDSPETHDEMLSINFYDLVDPSLGEIESSLQITYLVQIEWLLGQYKLMGQGNRPVTLIYGESDVELNRIRQITSFAKVKPSNPYGAHHSKIMIFSYTDQSIRVVVPTANLIESDWKNRTEGVWISPRCNPMKVTSDKIGEVGDSPTFFKRDLIKYLTAYKLPELDPWIEKLHHVNMCDINVFLVASVPGLHWAFGRKHDWGHPCIAKLLNEHTTVPECNTYPVIVQCSSMGPLGQKPENWLFSEMFQSLTSGSRIQKDEEFHPNFLLIYPSADNVDASYDGWMAGSFMPYSSTTHEAQEWITHFFHQWSSECRHRTGAIPHMKSYCRVSPDFTKLSYFLMTSANLSKIAWGTLSRSGLLHLCSYEAGVLFLPQFVIGKEYFPLTKEVAEDSQLFPLPYDLPATPYEQDVDIPWFCENIL